MSKTLYLVVDSPVKDMCNGQWDRWVSQISLKIRNRNVFRKAQIKNFFCNFYGGELCSHSYSWESMAQLQLRRQKAVLG